MFYLYIPWEGEEVGCTLANSYHLRKFDYMNIRNLFIMFKQKNTNNDYLLLRTGFETCY